MFCHSLNKCWLIIVSVGNVPSAKWKDKKANALPIFAFKRQVIHSPGEKEDIVKNSKVRGRLISSVFCVCFVKTEEPFSQKLLARFFSYSSYNWPTRKHIPEFLNYKSLARGGGFFLNHSGPCLGERASIFVCLAEVAARRGELNGI